MRYQEELKAVKDRIAAIEAETGPAEEELNSFYTEAGRVVAEAGGLEAWPDLNETYRTLSRNRHLRQKKPRRKINSTFLLRSRIASVQNATSSMKKA